MAAKGWVKMELNVQIEVEMAGAKETTTNLGLINSEIAMEVEMARLKETTNLELMNSEIAMELKRTVAVDFLRKLASIFVLGHTYTWSEGFPMFVPSAQNVGYILSVGQPFSSSSSGYVERRAG